MSIICLMLITTLFEIGYTTKRTEITVKQGDIVNLICQLPSQPNSFQLFSFEKDNDIISVKHALRASKSNGSFSIFLTGQNYTLRIKNAQKKHNGNYVCKYFDGGVIQEFLVTVLVAPSIPKINILSNELVAGSTVNLTCFSQHGSPPPFFEWMRNEVKLPQNQQFRLNEETSVLKLNLSESDDGSSYKCAVKNSAIDIPLETSKKLNVKYVPSVRITVDNAPHSHTCNIMKNFPVIMKCSFKSNPPPDKILWMKDGKPGPSGIGQWMIKSLDRSDSGNYSCKVNNEIGEAEDYFNLNVLYPPNVSLSQSHVVVNESAALTLECRVDSNPPHSTIVWKRNDVEISRQTGNILTIHPVSRSEAGRYTCEAFNKFPANSLHYQSPSGYGNATTQVIVQYPPTIDVNFRKLSAEVATFTRLSCYCRGQPLPRVHWEAHGNTFECTEKNTTDVYTYCSLIIPTLSRSDYGNYSCIASNILGSEEAVVELTGKTQPDVPHNFSITETGYSWIHVCWSPNFDGGLKQNFTVEISSPVRKVRSETSCVNITDLNDSTRYAIRVSAYNSIGSSAWTRYQECRTKPFHITSQDLPYMRNVDVDVDSKMIQFDYSPFFVEENFCIRCYYSKDGNLLEKYPHCLSVKNRKASIKDILLMRVKHLRVSICALEKQSVCGREVALDLDYGSRSLSIPLLIVVIISCIVAFAILSFSISWCKKRNFCCFTGKFLRQDYPTIKTEIFREDEYDSSFSSYGIHRGIFVNDNLMNRNNKDGKTSTLHVNDNANSRFETVVSYGDDFQDFCSAACRNGNFKYSVARADSNESGYSTPTKSKRTIYEVIV